MALTFPYTPTPTVYGNFRIVGMLAVGDTSYPTGGYPVAPLVAGRLTQVLAVFVRASPEFAANRLLRWNQSSNTIQIYTALGTEAANASDQSTTFVAITVLGR